MRQTVKDTDGKRYLLLKRSSDSSLVRDPATGKKQHLPNDQLKTCPEESALSVAVDQVPDAVQTLVTAVHETRALGLLLELDAAGPVSVRTLLDSTDFCESDLHGLLAELRAASLIAETTVAGERGYETTETASAALDVLTSVE